MKKLLSIILSVIYFALSLGVMINVHYCGGKIESVKINSELQTCCCGSEKISSDCCENEMIILDIDIDENISLITDVTFQKFFMVVHASSRLEVLSKSEFENDRLINYNLPPPKLEPLWLMNCTFTFYG